MRYCMQFDDAIRSHAICALVTAGDEAISKSYKCMDLAPWDSSSVIFFSSEP